MYKTLIDLMFEKNKEKYNFINNIYVNKFAFCFDLFCKLQEYKGK